MLQKFLQVIAPPQYTNPQQQQNATLLWVYLLLSLATNLIIYAGFALSSNNPDRPIFLISTLVLLVMLWLTRKGYLNLVKWSFLGFFWGYLVFFVSTQYGIYTNAYFWFISLLIFAGALFSFRVYAVLTIGFMLQTLLFAVFAYTGHIPVTSGDIIPVETQAVNYIAFAIVLSTIVYAVQRAITTTLGDLYESQQRYLTVIQEQTDYISRFKPDGTRLFINEAYCVSRESTHDAVMKENVFIAAEERGMILKGVLDGLTPENPIGRHTISRYKTDGTEVWEEWVNRAIYDQNNNLIEYQAVGRDITAQKQLEERERDLQLLEEREKFLQEFVSAMSHDLQTPLSVIRTTTYLMGKTTNPDKMQQRITMLSQQTDQLEEMIADIVVISRLEYIPSIIKEPTDIHALIDEVVAPLLVKATSKSITLTTELPPQPISILINSDEMYRALVNLIDNALNYTSEGGSVTVTMTVCAQGDQLRIEITDTGIGIPSVDIEHIFDRFYRSENAKLLRSGSGIGLAIVKKIIELHDGDIEVSSKINEGTTFTITLPLAQSPEAART